MYLQVVKSPRPHAQKGPFMSEESTLRSRLDQIIRDLQPELDELRVKLHLARADANDELAKWEQKLAEARVKAERVGDEAGDILEEKAKLIAAELRDGLERLKRLV